jgi:hypothetical protein
MLNHPDKKGHYGSGRGAVYCTLTKKDLYSDFGEGIDYSD